MMTTEKQRRTSYPKGKQELYQQMLELPKSYSVIALSKVNKVRATQLMKIRKKFHKDIIIKVIKNRVTQRAFEKISDVQGIDKLSSQLEGQCALMFTNISPFKLNLIFDQNKVFLPAKGGDITKTEIMIPSGDTGITPGPVLSEFKEANVPTKIDQGTIWVSKDTIVSKPGDVISTKLASLLSKLNIKPIEAGIVVNYAIADKLVFAETDLRIDLNEFRNELSRSHNDSISLAVESRYFTKESMGYLLSKASRNAQSLALESNYLSKETAGQIISLSALKANNLAAQLKNKGYSPS
ncbi:MAG TPA: 50S ribosomal protein L10 [Nitrososphaeraceae archaeon]|jgi:large subunit ribosomal protein L10|nr:50S ribosomal protein L10 [Nitrososphaeraceae archaeon]